MIRAGTESYWGMAMSSYDVVWPRSAKQAELTDLAERPTTLEGKTVAFLWDYLFRGDEIFPILEKELAARYPDMTFIPYQEFGTTHGAGETELINGLGQRLRELGADAIVSGMGC